MVRSDGGHSETYWGATAGMGAQRQLALSGLELKLCSYDMGPCHFHPFQF